jgi:hypothetical protein
LLSARFLLSLACKHYLRREGRRRYGGNKMSIIENAEPGTDSMHPDSGCYEEPYRLTGQNTVVITAGLFSIAAGVGSVSSTVAAGLTLAGLGVLMAAPLAFLIVSRRIAFRADREGITFGPQPVPFAPGRRFFWVSVPWKEVKEIRLDKEPIRGGGSGGSSSEPFLATGGTQQPGNLYG